MDTLRAQNESGPRRGQIGTEIGNHLPCVRKLVERPPPEQHLGQRPHGSTHVRLCLSVPVCGFETACARQFGEIAQGHIIISFPGIQQRTSRDPTGKHLPSVLPPTVGSWRKSGWVYRDKYFYLDSEQSHEAWIAAMREEGWRVWMARQTWDGTPCVYYGRPALRHALRRWFGPGPEPLPMPGGPEDP